MLEGIPFSASQLTLSGLIFVMILAFFMGLMKGWIIVKPHYDDAKESRDYWRKTSETKDKVIDKLADAVSEGRSTQVTVAKVMGVLQDESDARSGGEST